MISVEKQLELLLDFGKVLSQTNEIGDVLHKLADFAKEVLEADRCSIFIYDRDKDELWTKVAHGLDSEIRIPANKGIAGYAVLSKDIQIVVDAYNDFRFNNEVDKKTGYITKNILAVPLLDSNDNIIGVFQALNKKNGLFLDVDAQILLLLSNYAGTAIENSLLYERIKKTHQKIINKLASAAEFKDEDTSEHTKRVGLYSAILASAYGLSKDEVELIEITAPMHDTGKIGIADHILLKSGKLDEDEFKIMKTHSSIGFKLLYDKDDLFLQTAALIAKEHHEKWDGSGYPLGLKGEDISIWGRIVAIADVFDALVSERPYKKAWSLEKTQRVINEGSGTHFDPKLIQLFNDNYQKIVDVHEKYKD